METLISKIALVMFVLSVLISWKVYGASRKPGPQTWSPGCVASVPKSWGTFKGASTQSGLAFEDSAGTIRFLTNIPCDGTPVVSLEIHRAAATASNGSNP